jgi:hypothetical protein
MGNSQPKAKGAKAPRGGRKPGATEEKKAEQSVSGDGNFVQNFPLSSGIVSS